MITKFTWLLTVASFVVATGCSSDSKPKADRGNAAAPNTDPTVVKEDVAGGSLPGIEWSLVKFDFISPNDAEDLTGGHVKVEVAHNLPPIATWTLLYNKSFKSIEGGTVIAENQASTVKKVDWDVSKMEPGNYFLFAVIKYGSDQNLRFLSSSIPIEDEEGDNRTPFMSLITNINERVLAPGAVQALQFIGVDPDGDDVTLGMDYTADDGTTWVNIFKDIDPADARLVPDVAIAGQVSYSWTIPPTLSRGARYRVRLTAKDTLGKVGEAVTQKFGVAAAQVTYQSDVRALLTAKCISCHNGTAGTAPGSSMFANFDSPVLTGNTTRMGAQDRRTQITARTVDNVNPALRMPPSGSLTPAELDLIQLWEWGTGANANSYSAGAAQPSVAYVTAANTAFPENTPGQIIQFTITDADSPTLTVLVQYRLNNTGPFTDIETLTNVPRTTPYDYSWTTPDLAATTPVELRLIISDAQGRWRTNDNTRSFSVTVP
jgi:hypothetical protein